VAGSSQDFAAASAGVEGGFALPGYTVLGELGRGGMAIVYKARQLCPQRLVAVKLIDPNLTRNKEIVARFLLEQALSARLAHPNLVAAYHAGCLAGRPYLVMEYVEGDNLAGLARQHGPLPVAQACEVIRQAALGLQHLHEQGLLHRDIKPANLMLSPAGVVKVLDLGLARDLHALDHVKRITAHGKCLGTVDYMAPEQCLDPRAADIRADLYSLGCTLYELLAGQPPFAGPGFESIFQKLKGHVEAAVPPLGEHRPDVPRRLAVALERMLAKDRNERFARPVDVVAAVLPFAAGADLANLTQTLPPVPCRQPERPDWTVTWPSVGGPAASRCPVAMMRS
jgi:serine/threonine protein kinase